ncbi:phage tail tape measure protein [uncultured Kocuria sp.]|uniref:phage tail tape measure protein n=1 Tax=uncultured Kocuria sp. TaxID=259305 RepID=UPI00261EB5D6|nr:phage tail tape measure protein [uncultured Kocuria sp.]
MANNISILIKALGHQDAVSAVNAVANATERSGDKAAKADKDFKQFARTLGVGLLAAGTAAAAGLAASVKSAGNYESSLSQLKQASQATGEEMSAMSELARELGASNDLAGVSAADAAKTMVELSKAGLSVEDTMDAAKSVMSLAKAGNIEFADAAVIAASALNAFGLEGSEAIQVADMLAAGANASQAELGDLADGMQQSATVAKQFGLNLNETVTALSLFANNGIRGSDAGTSLKTMLIALAKPSKDAATAMEEIGFNAYDASGKFVGLEEMSRRLKNSTKGLTEEQKQNTLATIFGTDAFRAAAVLADNAGTSYDSMSNAVGKSGAAQQAAAAQMGGFQRASEGLRNSMSELGLTIGSMALPYVTQLTNEASRFVQAINAGIPGAVATFNTLLPVVVGLTAGITAFTIVQNAATVATWALSVAQGALNLVMKANPIALVTGAVVALVAAFWSSTNAANGNKNATNDLANAKRNAKAAADDLRGAELGLEQANLRVERATRTHAQAVRDYGAGSLEAREAAAQLSQAEHDLAGANDRARDAVNKNKGAQQELANQESAVAAAEKRKQGAFALTADQIRQQNDEAAGLNRTLGGLNGRTFSFNVVGKHSTEGSSNSPVAAPKNKNAIGTIYSPGGRTLVGEHGPEIVNLPRGSQVTQAYRTRSELAGEGAGGVTNNLSGNFTFQTAESVEEFFKRIDKTQRLARIGMAS